MIKVNNIKLEPSETVRFDRRCERVEKELKKALVKKLRISENDIVTFSISKQSVDARKKDEVKVVFSLNVWIKEEAQFLKKNRDKDIIFLSETDLIKSEKKNITNNANNSANDIEKKIVVVGAGPAGLFCALKLAESGLKPVLLERGEDVDARIKTVDNFWQGKLLNPSSNVQFGEGGAGTFSDGKLNTMVKDAGGRMSEVYRTFVRFGADESILYVNKPHLGTDKLTGIVKAIRQRIIELGGEVRFSSQVTDIKLYRESGVKEFRKVTAVILGNGTEIECDTLVLALGHSARDTFEMLASKGIAMEQKPFAMGVRVQHPREYIDRLQYGRFHEYLPAADYKLTYSVPNERSVYSFCMCPGGYVVNASSEDGRLAVNGMSYSGRDSSASNSAIVVQINTSDFPAGDVLSGMRLQRSLEKGAFKTAGGKIPVQTLSEFAATEIKNCNGLDIIKFGNKYFSDNMPVCKGEWAYADLNAFLPEYISGSIIKAFPHFGNMMKGYDSANTLILGLESRTSSPVRIIRGENLQSINVSGLYPCGEGAGYAGGITSAAMDGLRVAESIMGTVL
ncbi:MAG: NAD(P)/FAD-dependent oxidoreductase [Lachnospiraceae bacterium]|nr:NAD(P)/FAD-dependent oxidoreductase [Lachnospiraceae bacterium]